MLGFLKKKSQGTKITFKIGKMHCVSCGLNIDGALEDTEGVFSASTNYAKAQTVVEYDPKLVKEAKLKTVIEDEGYQVK